MIRDMVPERVVRLLRAKSAELEADVRDALHRDPHNTIAYLTADIALIAALLADHIERTSAPDEANEVQGASKPAETASAPDEVNDKENK